MAIKSEGNPSFFPTPLYFGTDMHVMIEDSCVKIRNSKIVRRTHKTTSESSMTITLATRRERLRNLFGLTILYLVALSLLRGTWSTLEFRNNLGSESTRIFSEGVGVKEETTIARIPSQPDLGIQNAVQNQVVVSNSSSTTVSFNPFSDCVVTTQVRLYRTAANAQWMLQSMDALGNAKTVGGDEYYITYTTQSNNSSNGTNVDRGGHVLAAVALITDCQNGTYLLDFVSTPQLSSEEIQTHYYNENTNGTIAVYFVYTCGIGNAYPPLKQEWKTGGATRIAHEQSVTSSPPIRPFKPPTLEKNLASYSSVEYFGDSHIRQLVGYWKAARTFHHRLDTIYKENPRRALTMATLDSMLTMLEQWHGNHLQNNNTALILGSSAWDIGSHETNQGTEFKDHLEAVQGLVSAAQERYPGTTIYWKEPAAIHIHCANPNCWTDNVDCAESIPYMSDSRVRYIRKEQGRIMAKLNVSVLQVYQGTYLSAHSHSSGDALHYERDFNKQMQSWFYESA